MNIIPQKRSAEASESVKRRPKNTKSPSDSSPDKSDSSDPIEKCFGEGVLQSGSDEDECNYVSEDEIQVFICPDPNDPEPPKIPVYCYRCEQADDHFTAYCHLPPEYLPVVEVDSESYYCHECEKANVNNYYTKTRYCPHKIICDN